MCGASGKSIGIINVFIVPSGLRKFDQSWICPPSSNLVATPGLLFPNFLQSLRESPMDARAKKLLGCKRAKTNAIKIVFRIAREYRNFGIYDRVVEGVLKRVRIQCLMTSMNRQVC